MGRDRAAIIAFFNAVMDKSPLPVMIYNFPYVFLSHARKCPDLAAVRLLASTSRLTSLFSSPSTRTVLAQRYVTSG